MITPDLAPSPPTAPRRVDAPAPRRLPAPQPRRAAPFGRVLAWSLLASVLIHAAVVVLSPTFLRVGPPPGETDTPYQPTVDPIRMRMVAPEAIPPVAVSGAPAEAVLTPTPGPVRRERPATPAERPRAGERDETVAVPEGTSPAADASDALQPGFRDPRLWIAPREIPPEPEPTDHERYMEHLHARFGAYNDSVYAAAERKRSATDWTIKDKDGNRWGISPDGIHLGGITIPRELVPVPAATGDNQTIEDAREKQRRREEIQRQADEYERRKTREERTKATRERKERERGRDGGG